ncbi:MAG: protein kinase, partial [Planctomycetales bacterium]|nr:protein kinase [Planctomycetales bacterium]
MNRRRMTSGRESEPDIGHDATELHGILEQYEALLQAGTAPPIESFVADYPQHAQALAQILPTVQVLLDLSEHSEDESVLSLARDSERAPRELGDFRLQREIGRGGMGIVYEAEQLSLRRQVAVKVLPFACMLDSQQLQRFMNEARAAASLHHPHIVNAFYVGQERGLHFYAMRLINGVSLAELIERLRAANGAATTPCRSTRSVDHIDGDTDTLPAVEFSTHRNKPDHYRAVARLGRQAADALEYAHSMGIVHRDI